MSNVDPETISFIRIKVACNQVMQAASEESIARLVSLVNCLPPGTARSLYSHLLFVLMQVLQNKQLNSRCKIQAVECITTVLSSMEVTAGDSFLNGLVLNLLSLMYDPENGTLVLSTPEELHFISIKCIELILNKIKASDRAALYSPKQAPMLGVLVCLCLKQASSQELKKLRIAAIECLMACAQVLDEPVIEDRELHIKTADIFMNFTPGIAVGLQSVISADEKQGHGVTLMAIRAWGRLLAQVFDDDICKQDEESDGDNAITCQSTENIQQAESSSEIVRVIRKNKRTASWLAFADSKLLGNVKTVCDAHKNSHPLVRKEMASAAELLIMKCSKSLPQCIPALLETLLVLSEDEFDTVALQAQDAMQNIADKCADEDETSLVELLEESFYNLISTLPSNFIHADKMQQRSQISLLLGHIKLFEHRLSEALLLASHMEALCEGLLQVVTLEYGSVAILAETSVEDLKIMDPTESRPWCRFKHFSDAQIQCHLQTMFKLLGKYADRALLTSQFLRPFVDRPVQRAEVAFILNKMLCGVGAETGEQYFDLIWTTIKAYLAPNVWNVQLSITDDVEDSSTVTLGDIRRNAVQACLLTEGIATLTAALGLQARKVISHVLYCVLERTGSSVALVSHSGRVGLNMLARALDYTSPCELLRCEADYFTHAVAVSLRRPKDHPGALVVLSAALTHSSKDILPCIEHIIIETLTRSCDKNLESNTTDYLKVFHAVVWNVQRWIEEAHAEDCVKKVAADGDVNTQSLLVQELLARHNWQMETGETVEPAEEAPSSDVVNDDSAEQVVPDYIKITVAVVNRCIHELPSPVKERQLIALSTLNIGVQVLAPYEDQLLPIVHRIWSPLLQRFSPTQDIVVLRHSFELLCTMAHAAKTFLRKRTLDKVLPSISTFLINQAAETSNKKAEKFSQTFKLQKAALESLGQLCSDLQLQEQEIDVVLSSCSAYLSSEQPSSLQASCLKLYRELSKLHPDAVWLQLYSLWSAHAELHPPHNSCLVIKFPQSSLDGRQFRKNCSKLLLELQVH